MFFSNLNIDGLVKSLSTDQVRVSLGAVGVTIYKWQGRAAFHLLSQKGTKQLFTRLSILLKKSGGLMKDLLVQLRQQAGFVLKIIIAFTIIAITSSFSINISEGGGLTPEETVKRYYNASKNGNFEEAYEYISKKFNDGKNKAEWSKAWKDMFAAGQVVILETIVSPAKINKDKATVKVKNTSKDIFNPKGLVEYEIDHLSKEDGVWKIDETEVLMGN